MTGAAAILASRDNPNSLADVQEIGETIKDAGNDGWIDDSPDGVKEPLLDVGDPQVFDPVMLAGPESNAGWSHDLKIRCAKSLGTPTATFYQDTTQCGADGRNWSLAVSALDPVSSCPGPAGQAFAVNAAGTPPILGWYQHWSPQGPNWTVNAKIDNVYNAHACVGSNITTTTVFGKQGDSNGGPLPNP